MLIALAGLVAAFLLILLFSNRPMRHCRWRARRGAGAGRAGDVTPYKCMTCGAETVTRNGQQPRECLRPVPPPGL